MKSVNTYKTTAKYYDSDNKDLLNDDIDFYIQYANELNGNVLEVGCGTGRITIPLARAGHQVCGVDISQPMLDILAEKLKKESKATVENLEVIPGDMRNFNFNEKFKLIFIPFRTFQNLVTDEEQKNCLQCCHQHLEDDGLIIVNVFRPWGIIDESWIQPEQTDYETTKNGVTVKRTHIRESVDSQNQIIYPTLIYYVTESGKTEKFYEYLQMKYFYPDQLRDLLKQNGFEVIDEFGYYDKCKLEDGSEIIFVCRKK